MLVFILHYVVNPDLGVMYGKSFGPATKTKLLMKLAASNLDLPRERPTFIPSPVTYGEVLSDLLHVLSCFLLPYMHPPVSTLVSIKMYYK